jgi:saccharopine dehydrogenase-like NADP-dependent oxidoreductase
MSRVVVVGSAGGMGRFVVRTLVRSGEVDEIVVADRDRAGITALAAHYGPAVRPYGVDIDHLRRLDSALEGADAVVNTAGPFFRTGTAVLDSVLRRGGVYIDVDDDPAPTLAALARQDEALRSGATCLVGLGASPGVTNLLACLAAERLDATHEVVTAWNIGEARPPRPEDDPTCPEDRSSAAAMEHFVREAIGTVLQLRDGAIDEVAPLVELELHLGDYGAVLARTVGHPEAVTLHRRLSSLRTSTNVFFGSNEVMASILAALADAAHAAGEVAAHPGRRGESTLATASGAQQRRLPALAAVAIGERDGVPAQALATMDQLPPSGMGGATGVPAAIGALLSVRGALPQRAGVFAPEELVPIRPFLAELQRWCPEPGRSPVRMG